jgi:AraC-like DNA-binding protein
VSAEALLAGLQHVGLDEPTIRAIAGMTPQTRTPGATLPMATWGAIWRAARARSDVQELPTRVGLAVPFGAFGMVDYLVGSAASVEGAVESLAQHFPALASGFGLEVQRPDATRVVVSVLHAGGEVPERDDNDEFTIAVIIGRLRALCPRLRVTSVTLARELGATTRHAELLGAPVVGAAASWSFEFARTSAELSLERTDARLHETMREIAKQLGLGEAQTSLELAIRARLRDLLRDSKSEAPHVARLLGLSERSLHRKLAAEGRSFQDILDDFRAAESQRLLIQGQRGLSEIAAEMGFSEQSAWARAFRRWTGSSPTEWRVARQTK